LHVAAYVEQLGRERSAPTVKQRLAAVRHLFDWLVTGQVMPVNPASSVRGPSHSVKRGKTPVLDPSEARQLLDAIDVSTPVGLRDRALIGLMDGAAVHAGRRGGLAQPYCHGTVTPMRADAFARRRNLAPPWFPRG
jgi:site-specific recombinase XerC